MRPSANTGEPLPTTGRSPICPKPRIFSNCRSARIRATASPRFRPGISARWTSAHCSGFVLGPKSLLDVTSALDAFGHRASEGGSPVDGEILGATEDALVVGEAGSSSRWRRRRCSLASGAYPVASLPLDVVVQGRPMARPGLWLVDHWDDLSASALPEPAKASFSRAGQHKGSGCSRRSRRRRGRCAPASERPPEPARRAHPPMGDHPRAQWVRS